MSKNLDKLLEDFHSDKSTKPKTKKIASLCRKILDSVQAQIEEFKSKE